MADDRSRRVLVVDDDPIVRAAVSGALGDAGYEVSVAESGDAAVELAESLRPDVIVMDVLMPPGISGIEATRAIAQKDPAARIVMFSVHRNEDVVASAVAAGATSYVTKHASIGALLDAVARTLEGQSVLIPAPKLSPRGSGLTRREYDVLELIAEGLTARDVAGRLDLSRRTVENHLQSIYAKLGVANRAQLVRAAVSGQAVDAASGPSPRIAELTQRERHIAELVAQGLTTYEIATQLHLSVHTVRAHLSRIYWKLGATSRDELVRLMANQ